MSINPANVMMWISYRSCTSNEMESTDAFGGR
jgi:hypothetical protein